MVMLRWQRPGNWDLTCLQTLPCLTNDIEQHCPPQAGVWIMLCLGKRRHLHPAELTPPAPFTGVCAGRGMHHEQGSAYTLSAATGHF